MNCALKAKRMIGWRGEGGGDFKHARLAEIEAELETGRYEQCLLDE